MEVIRYVVQVLAYITPLVLELDWRVLRVFRSMPCLFVPTNLSRIWGEKRTSRSSPGVLRGPRHLHFHHEVWLGKKGKT